MGKKSVERETTVIMYEYGVLSRLTVKRQAYRIKDENCIQDHKKDKQVVIDQDDSKRRL